MNPRGLSPGFLELALNVTSEFSNYATRVIPCASEPATCDGRFPRANGNVTFYDDWISRAATPAGVRPCRLNARRVSRIIEITERRSTTKPTFSRRRVPASSDRTDATVNVPVIPGSCPREKRFPRFVVAPFLKSETRRTIPFFIFENSAIEFALDSRISVSREVLRSSSIFSTCHFQPPPPSLKDQT